MLIKCRKIRDKILLWTKCIDGTDYPNMPTHCYCEAPEVEPFMIQCQSCQKHYHTACLKSKNFTNLFGDMFIKLTCETCSPDGIEICERIKMSWTQIIMLTLFNLHFKKEGGKCGYFRWKEHICSFIERNWTAFFGESRKKSATWHGTVAGSLSAGVPSHFRSGTAELGQYGWWSLATLKPPSPTDAEEAQTKPKVPKKKRITANQEMCSSGQAPGGLRHRGNRSLMQAAIELKEKRSSFQGSKRKRSLDLISLDEPIQDDLTPNSSFNEFAQLDESLKTVYTEPISAEDKTIVQIKSEKLDLEMEDEDEMLDIDDFNIQDDGQVPYTNIESPSIDDLMAVKFESDFVQEDLNPSPADVEQQSEEAAHSDSDSSDSSQNVSNKTTTGRKYRTSRKQPEPVEESPPKAQFEVLSVYEEQQLLKQLNNFEKQGILFPEARRLRRKLIVRQVKRERNIPVFDLDSEMRTIYNCSEENKQYPTLVTPVNSKDKRVLDRYQFPFCDTKRGAAHHCSFATRLLGLDESQLECIVSPYTQRTLKPFIFRDYETKPLKLKLLEEIVLYKQSNVEQKLQQQQKYPIDFCYVRPHHIPILNSMCRTFFWPGIELSECLEYPDFSCVVLYRKLIIGFAFMVPDVKYNEAYIPFIFTHPDWRKAGIAKFMLYHLIQTCMGKDVTLHVSATNPALFLYQKFGFKVEECILDFYDKYFPEDSNECKHAMFLRLSR